MPKTIQKQLLLTLTCIFLPALLPLPSLGQMAVGTNLSNPAEYNPTLYVDAFRQLREWRTRDAVAGAPFDSDFVDEIPLDQNGWPLQSPFDPAAGPSQIIHSIFPIRGAGIWTLNVQGTGTIRIKATEGVFQTQDFDFDGGNQQIQLTLGVPLNGLRATGFLEILNSSPSDPLRNMSFIAPLSQTVSPANPFQKSYFETMGDFSFLRFMDLARTNNNQTVLWDDRVTPNFFSQGTSAGVALEELVTLANLQNRPAWFCVPARADDDYVRNMAALIRDNLDPNLKCFVEYSNETWNSIFSQSQWVQQKGQDLGLHPNSYTAGQLYHTLRSAEIWTIFEEEFGTSSASRLVMVMASQSANLGVTVTRMDALSDTLINPTGIRPDVLAIAPYFGGSVGDDLVAEGIVDTVTIDQILDRAENHLDVGVLGEVQQQSALADQHDVWLVTYEGGQHLVGNFGNENNAQLTDKLIAANRTARMGSLYDDYLSMLNQNDVKLHCNYVLAIAPGKFGSWGILEDQDQPAGDAPKFSATMDWIDNNPPQNLSPIARIKEIENLIDFDGSGSEFIEFDGRDSRDLDGEIVQWEWFVDGIPVGSGAQLTYQLSVGQYELTLKVTDNGGSTEERSQILRLAPVAAASVLVESDFEGPNPSAQTPWDKTSQLNVDAVFSGWSFGAGLLPSPRPWEDPSTLANAFGFTGVFDASPVSFAESLADDNYLSFTVSPEVDHVLDLRGATMSLTIFRRSYNASRRFYVLSSVGGFDQGAEIYASAHTTSDVPEEYSFTLPFDGYRTHLPIEFRIYAAQGQYAWHQTSLDSFRLHGDAEDFFCGDVNRDGSVNFLDIAPFISFLSSASYLAEADINNDATVSFLDIAPFVLKLSGM